MFLEVRRRYRENNRVHLAVFDSRWHREPTLTRVAVDWLDERPRFEGDPLLEELSVFLEHQHHQGRISGAAYLGTKS